MISLNIKITILHFGWNITEQIQLLHWKRRDIESVYESLFRDSTEKTK